MPNVTHTLRHLSGTGVLALEGGYGPHWLVGNDYVTHFAGSEVHECGGDLVVEHALGESFFTLVLRFTDTYNRSNLVAHGSGDFFAHRGEVFVEVNAAFAVAHEGVMHEVAQHGKADFSGVGAFVFIKRVLGGQAEFAAVNLEAQRLQAEHAGG